MTTKKEKLLIIDGNALIHRSFHALPPTIQTKDGTIVNAVYGFTTTLIKAIKDIKPSHIALTMDRPEPTFRHIEYKEYKATREKQPDELYTQFPLIKNIAKSFDIPIYEQAGLEADDLIGTIAATTTDNLEKIILTGDMDTLQLINDSTKIYAMSRGIQDAIIYDAQKVKNKYSGLAPNQMIDYKALRGDPSDNIPGVPRIGEKTAIELLTNFKTLDNLYQEIKEKESHPKIKPRILNLLKDHKKEAYLSKKLVTIKCDADFDFNLDDTKFETFDQKKVETALNKLEFKSLLPQVKSILNEEATDPAEKFKNNLNKFNYKTITKDSEFDTFISELKKQTHFTFDTETDSKKALQANLLGISFCWEANTAYYLVIKENATFKKQTPDLFNYQNNPETQNKPNPWLEKLKPIFEDNTIKKSGHNIKYDINVLHNFGIHVSGTSFDTRLASYILNPGTRSHDLDSLALTIIGHEKISKNDLLGTGKNKKEYHTVETEKLAIYSSEDADFTFKLINPLTETLKQKKLHHLFSELEIPLIEVLAKMEQSGISINAEYLDTLDLELSKQLALITKKIYTQAGESFNINSPKQLKVILFEKLAISTHQVSKTKTGLSTAASELEKIRTLHPIIPLIEEHRELSKLLSTYIKALPELIDPKTNRIHTSLNQTITATGRLSSQEPNLQNIPTRTDLGKSIRKAFVSKKGFKLLSLDYSQIELRLAAHLSSDPTMIKAFQDNQDIHTTTASKINNVKPEEVTSKMRSAAKAINFGILYGQGPRGLSLTANISLKEAQDFIDNYFESFKSVKEYIDKTIEKAEKEGQISTLFGRIRQLPDINSTITQVKKTAERTAINTPMQGSAADLIKLAMIQVSQLLKNDQNCIMLLQIHDELIFEVKEDKVNEYAEKLSSIMEKATGNIKLKVPILVDQEVGDNWGELKPLK